MRKTKIICTIGPASESIEMLEKMASAGMNIARLNMSHGDHASHAKIIKSIQTLNKKLDHPVAILLDTQGPEIRTGDMADDLHLNEGDTILKYGHDIGKVIKPIKKGDHVHVHNVKTKKW